MGSIVQPEAGAVVPIAEFVLPPLQRFLPVPWLLEQCRAFGLKWRSRHWNPALALMASIYKAINSGCSVRAVEQYVDLNRDHPPKSHCDGADFARARQRLPQDLFRAALRHTREQALGQAGLLWGTMRAVVVDGTTLRLPRTQENVVTFGRAGTGRGKSQLPLMRLVMLVCVQCGAVLDAAMGAYRTSERALLRTLVNRLDPKHLLIADRGFCSFLALWFLRQRGCEYLGRLHQTRKLHRRPLRGLREYLVLWPRNRLHFTRCEEWADLIPLVTEDLQVRIIEFRSCRKGYRPERIALCTTLLDADLYHADDLVALYCQRWCIETDLRHLKEDFGLSRLRSKTPDGVHLEVLAALVARSLLAIIIQQSGCVVRRTSLRQVRQLILFISPRMAEANPARRAVLYERLLEEISRCPAPYQERPPEPRRVVTKKTYYPYLSVSRSAWRRRFRQGVA